MKAIVISNNLLNKKSPASFIEQDLLEEFAKRGIVISAYCSSLGDLKNNSHLYKTIISKELSIWRYIFRIIRFILPDLAYLPDYRYISWGISVKRKIIKEIKIAPPDYIHSFSFEQSCHWLAYDLKKKNRIPWIATFFDSWTDYPHRKFKTRYFRSIDMKMERLVAENADWIVHNNEGIAQLWRERYGEEIAKKIIVIPLNADFSKERRGINVCNKKIQISHIGTFYPQRDASVFIDAVQKLLVESPQLRNCLKINFVGRVMDYDLEKIKKLQLLDVFNITGRIGVEDCRKYYQTADVFLATAGIDIENITYPSKIIKYFYYGKPILGISLKDTVLYYELLKSGNKVFEPDDITGIKDYLKTALLDYPQICSQDINYWKRFDVGKVVDLYYSNILNKIKHG